jgi:hypothetical protein
MRVPARLISTLLALVLGCAQTVPLYARGYVESVGVRPIADAASFSVVHARVVSVLDDRIAERIASPLRGAGYRETATDRADLLIWYLEMVGDDASARRGSAGFEAIWPREAAPLECPDRFDQRLAIALTDASRQLVWRSELCSDGAGRERTDLTESYVRELLKSFGMNRARDHFEFRYRPSSSSPAAGNTFGATRELDAPREPKHPDPGAAPASTERTPAPLLEEAPEPATVTAPNPHAPRDGEEEFAEPGPTWSAVTSACAELGERPDLDCAVVVVVASSAPVMELGYVTSEDAARQWKHDVRALAPPFCDAAQRHGLFEIAEIRISAPGERTLRRCSALQRP